MQQEQQQKPEQQKLIINFENGVIVKIYKGCRPKKQTVYLKTLSKLRLTPLPLQLLSKTIFF